MKKEQINALHMFMTMASQSGYGFGSIFGGMVEPKERYPYERLGEGYELRPIQMFNKKGEPVTNDNQYSNLYHNDLKVSDEVFRKGGMGGDFRDGYCKLIHYTRDKKREDGFSFGTHVIINCLGDIVLAGTGISSYPSLYGGNIGKLNDTYYNLLTGEEILTASSSNTIDSKNYIFVEHRYSWYNKELPLGVYRIDKTTGSYEFIDSIK